MFISVFIVLFALLSSSKSMEKVPFRKCKGGNTIVAVLMEPCNYVENSASSPPKCTFYYGSTVKVNAVFIAPFRSSVLEIVASVRIKDKKMPLADSGRNPCFGNLMPQCPVMKDTMYIFSGTFDIHEVYPVGSMEVKYVIRDVRTRKQLGCAIIPIVIRGGSIQNKI